MFRRVKAPAKADLEAVLQQLSTRLARMLEKEGVLTQDTENSYLTLDKSGRWRPEKTPAAPGSPAC